MKVCLEERSEVSESITLEVSRAIGNTTNRKLFLQKKYPLLFSGSIVKGIDTSNRSKIKQITHEIMIRPGNTY